jgi:hypothetical protein
MAAHIKGVNNVKSMTRVVHDSDRAVDPPCSCHTRIDGEWMHHGRVVRSRQPERLSAWSGALAQTWWREAQMLWRRALHQGSASRTITLLPGGARNRLSVIVPLKGTLHAYVWPT